MPSLSWIGKDKVLNHHNEVPYRVLDKKYSYGDENAENMIIHGDNLEALKSLLPKYEGKIKCIYIDPPYNTGNEGWIYNDNVNDPKIKKWLGEVVGTEGEDLTRHDKWLCMIYPRLRLLQKLLSAEGTLVVSISEHELVNLVSICKEIFATKQIQIIPVQMSGGKPSGGFNILHEYLVFITPPGFAPNPSDKAKNEYASPYHGMNLATFNQEQRPNQTYPIYIDNDGVVVGVGKSLQQRIDEGIYKGEKKDFVYDYNEAPAGTVAIWPVTSKGVPCVWRLIPDRFLSDWEKGFIKVVPQKPGKTQNLFSVQYLSEGIIDQIKAREFETYRYSDNERIPTLEVRNFTTGGVTIPTIWTEKDFYTAKGSDQITQIFGDKSRFQYPKPVDLIQEVLSRIVHSGDIILDSFGGSGTTGHAVLNIAKKDGLSLTFILIEMMDYAEDVTAERVKRVIEGYGEENKRVEGTGGGFSFYELGEQLLLNNEYINPNVDDAVIREYIWYMETRTAYEEGNIVDNAYYLGFHNDTAYYFNYEKDRRTVLDNDFLKTIKTKADAYVIYADTCNLSDTKMNKFNITFKKIPRDIARL